MTWLELLIDLKSQILEIPIEKIIQLRIKEYGYKKYLCPFHDDHTPNNFKINEVKNTFHCFACNVSGNGIDFIMNYDNIPFAKAVKTIALEMGLVSEKDLGNVEILSKKKGPIVEKKVEETLKADEDTLDKIYRIFMKGNTLIGKSVLSEEHLNKLKNERFLTDDEIKETGYFSFPNGFIMRRFQKELLSEGFDLDVLKTIPGFFYEEKTDSYSFSKLKNTTGIGIPILNVDGKVVGIQIRTDDDGRYQWFSSSFVNSTKVKRFSDGTSPGTPVSVFYPKKIDCRTIFITEGHFKARKITKEFGAISISVQGVNNWKEIPKTVNLLKERYEYLDYIMITYDADMSRNELVLYPSLKLGLELTGLQFNDDQKRDLYNILRLGSEYQDYSDEITSISDFLSTYSSKFHIYYCLWNEAFGKGIDDMLNAGHRNELKKMELNKFWKCACEYLDEINMEKLLRTKIEGKEYRKITVPEEKKLELFEKRILKKI